MIKHSKQTWEVGQTVRVGFLSLMVSAKIATPGDYRPDKYRLVSLSNGRAYEFTPHHGLERVDA